MAVGIPRSVTALCSSACKHSTVHCLVGLEVISWFVRGEATATDVSPSHDTAACCRAQHIICTGLQQHVEDAALQTVAAVQQALQRLHRRGIHSRSTAAGTRPATVPPMQDDTSARCW